MFDYQRTLAEEFGFSDRDDHLAVEQFMQQYYRTVMELNRLNEMLLQLFQEAILLHDQLGAAGTDQQALPSPQRLLWRLRGTTSFAATPLPCWRFSTSCRRIRSSRV